MAYRPADFFLGAIDFFGILVPGATLLLLQQPELSDLPSLVPDQASGALGWIRFFVASYILGHFLLGAGVPLNSLIRLYQSEHRDSYYLEAKDRIEPALPRPRPPLGGVLGWLQALFHRFWAPGERSAAFNRAFSDVRLENPVAAAEIERQAAEYKLFRSLTLVFLFDLCLEGFASTPLPTERLTVDVVLTLLAGWRFMFLLSWTQRLAFEFYVLLDARRSRSAASASQSTTGSDKSHV